MTLLLPVLHYCHFNVFWEGEKITRAKYIHIFLLYSKYIYIYMHKQIDKGEIIYYQYLSDKQKINRIDRQMDRKEIHYRELVHTIMNVDKSQGLLSQVG